VRETVPPDEVASDGAGDQEVEAGDGAWESDATSGDGEGASSLGDLPGLVLWLKPGKTVVDAANDVARWVDSSSYGHDAVQENPAHRPIAGSEPTSEDQQAIVTFDAVGTWLQVADDDSMHLGTGDFLCAAVVLVSSAALVSYDAIIRKQDSNNSPYIGLALWANAISPSDGTARSMSGALSEDFSLATFQTYDDDRFHLVMLVRSGTRLILRVDGYEELTRAPVASDFDITSTEPAYIGAHGTGPGDYPNSQQLQGSIAEILIVKGRGDDALIAMVEHDLAVRHHLPLP